MFLSDGGVNLSDVVENVLEIGLGIGDGVDVRLCKRSGFCVVDFIDWILLSLMWRFGFGVGLVWVGVFVFGVILE